LRISLVGPWHRFEPGSWKCNLVTRRFVYPLATWTLVVLLTAVAGVREGLHLVPGMGHEVTVGGQVVMVGDCGIDSASSLPPPCCFLAPSKESAQLLDQDDCPICHLLGMKVTAPVSGAMRPIEMPLGWAVIAAISVQVFDTRVYQARVPPQV